MTLLAYLASFFGVAMAISNIPQAYRIFKRKSGGDVSIITYSMLTIGSLVWLLYGIELRQFPIIVSYGIGILSCLTVAVGSVVYRK
jgi:MtN3 and saliva related transmembrane protein